VLLGRFSIHGVTREATVPAVLVFLHRSVRVRGETVMNLKDYGIRGLTKMMGTLRMHEEIVVHIDLLFDAGGLPPQALR
jgi:polyisoprenoid-binding protein YceI